MGLLLSILVTCVGVVELLTFCRNVRRRVAYPPTATSLVSVEDQCLKELEDVRHRLQLQLQDLRQTAAVAEEPLAATKSNVFNRKLGHSVEEADGDLYYRRSPSPFPSFDLTAPRNSLCSDHLEDVDEVSRSNSHSPEPSLRVFTSTLDSLDYSNSLGVPKRTLQQNRKAPELRLDSRAVAQPPTSPQFVDLNRNTSTHDSLEYWNISKVLDVSKRRRSKSRTPSPGASSRLNSDTVTEEEEEEVGLLLNTSSTHHSLEYWNTNKLLGVPKRRSKSRSASPGTSKCTNDAVGEVSDDEEESVPHYSEEMKNSLDGVDRSKTETKKKLLRRKKTKNAPVSGSSKAGEPFWLIFSGEYTKAMNKDWHGQHFCCWQCDESLTGQRYVLRDDHPYCVTCYESVFANACEKCSRTIGIDSKDLSYKDKHWHEACFLCTTCGESLVDKQFGSKGDRIYCGRCYDEQFASRCDGCHEIFRAGTKKMEYKTRQWHEKCFCCCVCKVPIGTQSFIPREQEIYCAKCYEDKYATRCIKCNKVITSGGVTYKNEPWHRECFTCTNCQKSLAGERFTSRDEKPFCADCFGELFAKRCFACNRPITGIGGTKFISFEDRHWHNDCFFCATCRTSLVGRGFITDQDDIICPECAKQKLM